jgi:rare lipoprotein A
VADVVAVDGSVARSSLATRTRRRFRSLGAVAVLASSVVAAACSTAVIREPSLVDQVFPAPRVTARGTEVGTASWYGPGFHGKLTATGEVYDQNDLTAAHRSLPLGSRVKVTDLDTGRSVVVRINDRGPYVADRILDLSYAAGRALGMTQRGLARVEIRLLEPRYSGWPVVRHSVQIGAFALATEADALARRARALGAPTYVRRTTGAGGGDLYRVRVGPYSQRATAAQAAAILADDGLAGVVIEEDPLVVGPSAPDAPSPSAASLTATGAAPAAELAVRSQPAGGQASSSHAR